MDWWFWYFYNEEKPVERQYTFGQAIVFCVAVLLLLVLSFGARIAVAKRCHCGKACSCSPLEQRCGHERCPAY